MINKQELRQLIRNEKRCFSRQQLAEMSLSVIRRLMSHPRLKAARTVLMYWSLPDEVDTHAAVEALAAEGKRVILPAVIGEGLMELRRFTGPADLREGAYGIMEPSGELFTDLGSIDLIVVPGMSFDAHCHRLGRGKGYYDRFLALTPHVYKIGICFDFQKKTFVPFSEHDVPVDAVL